MVAHYLSIQSDPSVINDILDLSKLEENKMRLEQIPTYIYDMVEEAMEFVSFEAEKKKLEVICDIQRSTPCAFLGDHTRWE